MLIGADRVVHQVQQDDADESDESDSSNSSNNMSVSITNDETAISTDIEVDQPDQSRIWSTSTSDVPGTFENDINTYVASRVVQCACASACGSSISMETIDQGHKEGQNSLPNCSNKSILYNLNFLASYLPPATPRWRNELMGRTQNLLTHNKKKIQLLLMCSSDSYSELEEALVVRSRLRDR